MSNILVTLAAEFVGKNAFKQAETATNRLTKSVRNLAGAFGIAFSTRAVVAYGKESVKAFAADDKAAKVLSRTLTNLGLAFADPEIKNFISTLEKQYGILDDRLRPAYQKLVTTTGDYKKSQSLLRTALDLSAQSGEDVVSVADDLGRAFVGNTKGLQKYSLGLSRAQLAAMSFEDILKRIAIVSNGQAALAADTYAGKLDKLTVAASNAQEVIGGALLDAVIKLGGGDVDKTTEKIDKLSTAFASLIRLATGTADMSLGDILKGVDYKFGFIPVDKIKSPRSASPAGTYKNMVAARKAREEALKQEKALAKLAKDQAAAALAILKAKKLAAVIDKANLALGKGADVFNIDKIQLRAAEINQAEQLGKATSQAQLLAITNDLARLRVKQDMVALEDAIASKDEKSIISATNKLNADLKILGALTGQNLKLADIKSILDSIAPKDLINLDNLYEAIKLLGIIKGGPVTGGTSSPISKAPMMPSSLNGMPVGRGPIGKMRANAGLTNEELQYFEDLANYQFADLFANGANPFAASSTSGNSAPVSIVNNFGVVGDPNAAAELVYQTVLNAQQRGTLRQFATS